MTLEAVVDETQLEELLSRPSAPLIEMFARSPGDIVVLGASGKMGPSLARMAKRASDAAATVRRVIGVARFSSGGEQELRSHGIETVRCDLLDEEQVARLPDAAHVVFMAGRKFGSTGGEPLTWAMNAWLPTLVCRRYRSSRIVFFSTGNVYGLTPVAGNGSRETDVPQPVGEYAMSCLARERLVEYLGGQYGTPTAIVRLNYACDLRYGVLVDLAQKLIRGEPIDLSMGRFNTIWQGDANCLALRALAHTASPPWIVNVTGRDVLNVRDVCQRLGHLLDRPARFVGREGPTALLSDASLADDCFGPPPVGSDELIEAVARWVRRRGRTLGKPTHFESRSGEF
ncbi:MAG TPA: NAD(P)-dependent oxidoreductase [Pirellulales bacterium]|nr:NAD(P)-dependent oxidoreductase [Pirellulales bacterium]